MSNKKIGNKILERIRSVDISKLIRYSYSDKDKLPKAEGIYFVGHSPKEIIYVGKTKDFRNRHQNHHRDHTFKNIEKTNGSLFIWCWHLPSDLKKTKVEGEINLAYAENAFRILLDPPINDTSLPGSKPVNDSPKKREKYRFNGGFYVSLNFLPEYSADLNPDLTPGFHTTFSKLHHVQRAVQQKSPCFLISSLPIKLIGLPEMSSYKKLLSPDPYWKRETSLYFLEYMFRARGYEKTPERLDFNICIYGDRETSIIRRIYLNDFDYFKDFRQSYLTMGMTNCSSHIFTCTLFSLVEMK